MKPSQRFKKRYVSFRLAVGGAAPSREAARQIVHEHFLSFFGESGISGLAFKLISYDEKTGAGMVRCERSRVDETIFCMACFTKWKGGAGRMEPVSTGGSVKRTEME